MAVSKRQLDVTRIVGGIAVHYFVKMNVTGINNSCWTQLVIVAVKQLDSSLVDPTRDLPKRSLHL